MFTLSPDPEFTPAECERFTAYMKRLVAIQKHPFEHEWSFYYPDEDEVTANADKLWKESIAARLDSQCSEVQEFLFSHKRYERKHRTHEFWFMGNLIEEIDIPNELYLEALFSGQFDEIKN